MVLNGNRRFGDILCKEDLDRFATDNGHKCTLLYTLTQAHEEWTGLRGRIGQALLTEYVSPHDEAMVLICGPKALEKSAHSILNELGWKDRDLLFF
jgi:nitrate reductase (NAD(P)H)